jgi:non-lysosomal glucosylceramidase
VEHASAVGTRGLAPRLHTNHGRSVVLMALVLVVLSLALRATSSSAAAATATAAGGDGLFALLQRVPFRNAGLAQRSDRYAWGTVPVASGAMFYLEKENVSCTQCSWGGNKGKHRFLVPPPPPPPAGGAAGCAALNATLGVDIAGHDLKNTQDGVTTSADCLRLCCGTPGCDGAVFLPKTGHSTNAACTNASRACCFLKTGSALAPRGRSQIPGIVATGVKGPNSGGFDLSTATVPPSGIRSAVPLGGISAGSVELRGDGSFTEWSIQNQSPAGAAKISVAPDALLALRLCGAGTGAEPAACAARLLQTQPRGVAANVAMLPAVAAINYSGTFPVSRLVPVDSALSSATGSGLSTALFAYSSLAAGDMEASARPAIAFTLTVRNAGPRMANASLLLNMPLQVETDQARTGIALGSATQATDSQACAAACQEEEACMSWNYVRALSSCQLQSNVGLNRYTLGSDAGVRGQWTVDSDGRCVTLARPGDAPTSGAVSLCTAAASGGSVAAHAELGTLLSTFGSTGALARGGGTSSGLQGAAVVATTVPPNSNRTISLTLGWRFPLRDWYNYDCDNDSPAADSSSSSSSSSGLQANCTCKNATSGLPVPLKQCPSEPRNSYCPASTVLHQCNPGCNAVTGCCNPPPKSGWSTTTCGGRFDDDDRSNSSSSSSSSSSSGGGSTVKIMVAAKEEGDASFAYANRYAEIYATAREAAWVPSVAAAGTYDDSTGSTTGSTVAEPPTETQLIATLRNISAVHAVFMHEGVSLPDWLQDQLVNSVSHVRNSYWFSNSSCPQCTRSADPRTVSDPVLWRQFEAFDCTDLDSIHNDGERHVPYIMLWPDSERSKLAAWANNQAPTGWQEAGMLAEQIHQNTPDTPDGWTANDTGSGRKMGDSSSAFVLEVLEFHRWSNDTITVGLYWETIKGIVGWQLKHSATYQLPVKLETSYDILGFPSYELAAYNSMFHIATLAAAAELADAMGDTDFAASCRASQSNATAAFDQLQWNGTKGAYDAGSDKCTAGVGCDEGIGLFADSFYAQVLAYSAGLGTLIADPDRLISHLKTQLKENCIYFPNATAPIQLGYCPNGLVALTGRYPTTPRSATHADLQIWEMAPPNHATLGLHLGQHVDEMLAVFEPSATSYSRRINDQWNTAGLKDTTGYPTATSHYGMHMVAWHIPLALSGQVRSN